VPDSVPLHGGYFSDLCVCTGQVERTSLARNGIPSLSPFSLFFPAPRLKGRDGGLEGGE
jgi:hypothetical protein